jgi:hypothetical protein
VHFNRVKTPILASIRTISEEQIDVERALRGVTAVQPAQIDGDRASVLAQRESGEFAVVSLEKRNGLWTTVAMLNAAPAGKPRRQP